MYQFSSCKEQVKNTNLTSRRQYTRATVDSLRDNLELVATVYQMMIRHKLWVKCSQDLHCCRCMEENIEALRDEYWGFAHMSGK